MNNNNGFDIQIDLWKKFEKVPSEKLLSYLSNKDVMVRNVAAKELQIRGEKITFDKAIELCKSDDELLREIGAFILGQLGAPDFPYSRESVPILIGLLKKDESELVRASAAASLGHLKDLSAIDVLSEMCNDPSPEVRLNIAGALGNFKSSEIAEPLLNLMKDNEKDVQSWAVHSFRAVNFEEIIIDSQQFRDLLAIMINESNDEIRIEAICALAKLKDKRVFSILLDELHREEVFYDLFDAASDLEDIRLIKRLNELKNEWKKDLPIGLTKAIGKLNALKMKATGSGRP
jgi:HEAT repeat protein